MLVRYGIKGSVPRRGFGHAPPALAQAAVYCELRGGNAGWLGKPQALCRLGDNRSGWGWLTLLLKVDADGPTIIFQSASI